MFQNLRTEFSTSPIQVTAALAALVASPATVILNLIFGAQASRLVVSPGSAPTLAAASVPARLLGAVLFAIVTSYAMSSLLRLVKNEIAAYIVSFVLMFVSVMFIGVFARQLLPDQFEFGSVSGLLGSTNLSVAGAPIYMFAAAMTLLVVSIFLASILARIKDMDSIDADTFFGALAFGGVIWFIPAMLLGGAILEAFLRAGLPSQIGHLR